MLSMSRSYKKYPFVGRTYAKSDRWYKHYLHSKRRRRVRDMIATGQYDDLDTDLIFDAWDSDKDGKILLSNVGIKSLRK